MFSYFYVVFHVWPIFMDNIKKKMGASWGLLVNTCLKLGSWRKKYFRSLSIMLGFHKPYFVLEVLSKTKI